MDTADLIFETHQDPAVVQAVLEQSGHTKFDVQTAGAPATEPPVEPAAVPEGEEGGAGKKPPVASPQAPATEATPAVETAPAAEITPPTPKPSRGYKHKFELQREENARLKEQLEKAAKPATPAAAPVEPESEAPAPAVEAAAAAAKPKPDPAEFENGVYDPAFVEALTDWKYDERLRLDREKVETADRDAQAKAKVEADTRDQNAFKTWWGTQISEAKERHEDFDAVISKDHGKAVSNPVMLDALQSMDTGGELAYWLGTNPEEAHRICKLTEFKPGETAVDFRRKLRLAVLELDKIELPDLPAIEDEPLEEEAEPAALVVAAAAAAAPRAVPAPRSPAPAPVKPAPPSPVGQRGPSSRKRLSQMSSEELRALDTDQWRKLKDEEYGKH